MLEGELKVKRDGKLEEKELLVRNLVAKTDLLDHQIAEVDEVETSLVEKIRTVL